MARIHDIRSAFFDKGESISAIAEEHRIDRKTVRKYINQDDWNLRERQPEITRCGILDRFKPVIERWLAEDRRRRRKPRRTAKRVYERLVSEHQFGGSCL